MTRTSAPTDTLQALRDLVVDKFDVKPDQLADDRHFTELGLDSLGMADLVFQVEDLFDVTIDYEQAMLHPTLGGFAGLVDGLRTAKAAEPADAVVA